MVDGQEQDRVGVRADGPFTFSTWVAPAGGRAIRFEVLGSLDAGVLYSNPVYFVDSGENVPRERLPQP